VEARLLGLEIRSMDEDYDQISCSALPARSGVVDVCFYYNAFNQHQTCVAIHHPEV